MGLLTQVLLMKRIAEITNLQPILGIFCASGNTC